MHKAEGAYLADMTAEDLEQLLDDLTRKAARDLAEIHEILDRGERRAKAFFAEIDRSRRSGART